jgi:site-specific DNA-methyltransferase (cytosine-N4-specific)
MPESVRDRFCTSHEFVFLLAKSERYHFDLDAVLEPCQSGPSDLRKMIEQNDRIGGKYKSLDDPLSKGSAATNIGQKRAVGGKRSGNKKRMLGDAVERPASNLGRSVPWEGLLRTPRSVWRVNTQPYQGAHFAVMPEELAERCILAGSRPGDLVFDPFMGSGTTAQVAQRLGRKWLGAELNPRYIELQAKRTAQFGLELA